jgi:hypothetical protein
MMVTMMAFLSSSSQSLVLPETEAERKKERKKER